MGRKRIINIGNDSEFKIKIEKIEEFSDSFFYDVYISAAKNVKEIIANNNEYHEIKSQDNISIYKDKEEKNNIIAFAGERGAGKTSAMVSFAYALKSEKKSKFEGFDKLDANNFWVMDTIDPSLFEHNESIFQVVIAKLFQEFTKEVKGNIGNSRINKERAILQLFEEVYKNFKTIMSNNTSYTSMSFDDTLEALSNLAASSNMRQSFTELIQELLKYQFGEQNIKNHYLVLPIDDLDMNIAKSADMAEQIRKYLMIPNVIILMAVKVEQLTDSIEQMFRSEYEIMLKSKVDLEDDTKNMAGRYIEKLIPNGRKIYLPNFRLIDHLDEISLNFTEKTNVSESENEFKEKKDNNANQDKKEGIQNGVLGLVYRKTGLIFIKPKKGVHYLIPDNMRELHNLISIFSKLEDIHNIDLTLNRDVLEKNIVVFENYFYNVWIKRNLNNKYALVIKEFRNEPLDNKNKFIINTIAEIKLKLASETIINKDLEIEKFGQSLDIDNYNYNISLGDVLDCFEVNKDYDNEEVKQLKFAIKTVYSIEIFKNLFKYKDGFNEIYKLTAGNVLGKIYEKCLPASRSERYIDDYDKLFISIDVHGIKFKFALEKIIEFICPSKETSTEERLKKLFENSIADEVDKQVQVIEKLNDKEYLNVLEEKFIKKVELLHYFLFQGASTQILYKPSTSKSGQVTIQEYPSNYRVDRRVYYDIEARLGTGGNSTKSARMSLLAFITKSLNPERIIDTIFNARLEQVKSDIDKNYIIEKSNVQGTKDWNSSYGAIIPIYSLEVLSSLSDNLELKVSTDFKFKRIGNEYNLVTKLFDIIGETLESITNENPYLKNSNIIHSFEKSLVRKSMTEGILEDELVSMLIKNDVNNKKKLSEREILVLKEINNQVSQIKNWTIRRSNKNIKLSIENLIKNIKEIDDSNKFIRSLTIELVNLTDERLKDNTYKKEKIAQIKEIVSKSQEEIKLKFDGE